MASLVFSRFFSLLVIDLVMFATYEYKYYFLKKKVLSELRGFTLQFLEHNTRGSYRACMFGCFSFH